MTLANLCLILAAAASIAAINIFFVDFEFRKAKK